jgi:hypothetical protein
MNEGNSQRSREGRFVVDNTAKSDSKLTRETAALSSLDGQLNLAAKKGLKNDALKC